MVVRFRINATGETVTKFFASPYLVEKFIRKLQFSKKVTLISYGKPY